MAENDQKPDLIKEYLRRLKIQEKSGSFNDYAERLTHLSIIRDILARLSAAGYASSEGTTLLGTREQPLGTVNWGPPDFIVLKEDVLIYVYLVIGPTGELTATQLQGVWTDLKENPALSAVATCWPEKGYPSSIVDSFTIRNYLERPSPLILPTDALTPLPKAIEDFVQAQLVNWQVSTTNLQLGSRQRIHELSSDLRDKIRERIASEKLRNYEIAEKVEALRRVSSTDIEELVEKITAMIAKEDTSSRSLQELENLIESLCQR
jgi:hypothetical protein